MLKKMRTIEEILNSKRILLWGAGEQSKSCIQFLKSNTNAELHLFDSNETKIGSNVEELVVESQDDFIRYLCEKECVVLISCINYQYSIAEMLVRNYKVSADILYGYTNEYYEKNIFKKEYTCSLKDDIEYARSVIEDEESKNYFDASIRYRFNRNPLELVANSKMQRTGEYADIVNVHEGDTIVDCGAYVGDTSEMYCSYVKDKCTVYAFEPFYESFLQLEEYVKRKKTKNVYAYNYAVSNENRESAIFYNDADLKMGINIERKEASKKEIIKVRTLDSVLLECSSIDFIKMDIEGEEMNALMGAKNILKKFSPDLMISAYHKFEHIIEIPKFLKSINSDYRIFVGHAPNVSTEIEIYATAK